MIPKGFSRCAQEQRIVPRFLPLAWLSAKPFSLPPSFLVKYFYGHNGEFFPKYMEESVHIIREFNSKLGGVPMPSGIHLWKFFLSGSRGWGFLMSATHIARMGMEDQARSEMA